jgi:hypothetical protein
MFIFFLKKVYNTKFLYIKVSAGTPKYISLLETFWYTMHILNQTQGKLIIMPLNVISFAIIEFHMYYIKKQYQ